MAAWMEQQAAEYADLVGSFVESVVDSDTDEMIEYQLIWEGGDLGVALTTLETENTGVQVSRVTGKGFPFGIKNVGPGDILLSINLADTTKMTLDQVVGFLQECDLPATLRFKKVSPDMDKMPPRASVPRVSQFVVTSSNGPTSPTGSAPPPSAGRASNKGMQPPQNQRQSSQGRPSTQNRASTHSSQGRASTHSSQGRPSVPYQYPTELPSPPPAQQQKPTVPPAMPVPVSQQQHQQKEPRSAAPAPVPEPMAAPKPTPAKTEKKPVAAAATATVAAVPAVVVKPAPKAASPVRTKKTIEQSAPVAAAAATAVAVAAVETPAPAPAKAEPTPVAAPTVVVAPVQTKSAPTLDHAMSREVEEIMMMGSVSNDLGFDDESSSDEEEEEKKEESKPTQNTRVSEDFAEEEDDAFVVETEEHKYDENTYHVDESVLPETRQKSSSSVAMLGHYSIETGSNTVPVLPEVAEATGIAFIDNVNEFADSDPEDQSPNGFPVQPSDMRNTAANMPSSPVKSDGLPRESIRMTMDGGAEPMMKSQPIGTLHELCAKGNLRGVVQHLRVEGSDGLITREPNHGQTGLHLAVKSGNVPLVKVVLEHFKPLEDLVNLEDDKGNTALHFAATKTPAMVHILLENGASANVKNSRKLTPLIISVITSRDDSVIIPRMLLKFGANPNDMHESHTVIHTAIGSGLLQIAGALVKAGAKMDVEDTDGKNVFEKLDRKSTKLLLSHIYFPPTYITEKERSECMLCNKKIKFGHRKCNCTHCGRFCCSDCCALSIEMYKFPMGFPGRTRRGAAVRDPKRVCKTCYAIFKERNEQPEKQQESKFLNRIIGIEWDEVNPNKLAKNRTAGRRGEKE